MDWGSRYRKTDKGRGEKGIGMGLAEKRGRECDGKKTRDIKES